ncbi:hypothetical protein COV24_03185 [candidate division WWE3 bacterium CG10_big_fil_rev_8_21_14_0_10_32_10]|uniref:HTH cro/C1-type domain-containing protein n=1 Tax=candidate division WWE3 bacterium CG10_big_fil_rev_8_21_14_0_10_32_10 TaxID=1975090 RepID=A0A2H0RA02_UNCKA|nr:MAG: hypothetical protein COV24_03185 [candidate division WWE3 bacterium CG10_big_fil_rev_8_21_14_0_10_32_10]
MNISKKIQDLRQKSNLTQEELAAKVGLSRVTITSIEQGKRKVAVEELSKFCEALGCTYTDFFSSSQQDKATSARGSKKNLLELYGEYKEKYQGKVLPKTQEENPLDDYLRDVNPYYYPSTNNEIRYEQ